VCSNKSFINAKRRAVGVNISYRTFSFKVSFDPSNDSCVPGLSCRNLECLVEDLGQSLSHVARSHFRESVQHTHQVEVLRRELVGQEADAGDLRVGQTSVHSLIDGQQALCRIGT